MSKQVKTVVLLLKSPGKDGPDSYIQALEAEGLSASCVPVLDFEFVGLSELSKCLSDPEAYSGIILTSPRAVEAVTMATGLIKDDWSAHLFEKWSNKSVFVVGESTAKEVSKLGLKSIGSESGNAESLVGVILNSPDICPGVKPLLFPVSALARDVIPSRLSDAGIGLHQLTIYKTVPHPEIEKALKQFLTEQSPSHVVFFSPSGLDFTWDIWRHLGVNLTDKCVAIGPTTKKALEDRGLHPLVASKPAPANLVSALTQSTGQ